ncbi:hypothetical protein Nepgr_022267 [Nepenthes gracilis]|uniref:Uncharacterized protein n=1 Tax=Nepenthes gracilis TaxID=150966 RepID=A0AAD3T0H6_NEPGR|nr:hypothetical protein Nepgr_022267 [Nepenthes gracilis]
MTTAATEDGNDEVCGGAAISDLRSEMAAPHTVVVVLNLPIVLSFKCRAAPPQTSPPSFSSSSPLFLALPPFLIAVLS